MVASSDTDEKPEVEVLKEIVSVDKVVAVIESLKVAVVLIDSLAVIEPIDEGIDDVVNDCFAVFDKENVADVVPHELEIPEIDGATDDDALKVIDKVVPGLTVASGASDICRVVMGVLEALVEVEIVTVKEESVDVEGEKVPKTVVVGIMLALAVGDDIAVAFDVAEAVAVAMQLTSKVEPGGQAGGQLHGRHVVFETAPIVALQVPLLHRVSLSDPWGQ